MFHPEGLHRLNWVDSFFLCVAAVSLTGWSVVPFEKFWRPIKVQASPYVSPEQAAEQLIEYRALGHLDGIMTVILVSFVVTGAVLIYVAAGNVVNTANDRQEPLGVYSKAYFSVFTCLSAFTNAGISLLGQGMVPFMKSRLMITVLCVLMACGNTCFPFVLWASVRLSHYLARDPNRRAELEWLSSHPRRCTTHLFPNYETAMLLLCWVVMTSFQFLILVLDFPWNKTDADTSAAGVHGIIDQLIFSTIATRTAAFSIWAVAGLSAPGLTILLVYMFVGVYPQEMALLGSAKFKVAEQEGGLPAIVRKDTSRMSAMSVSTPASAAVSSPKKGRLASIREEEEPLLQTAGVGQEEEREGVGEGYGEQPECVLDVAGEHPLVFHYQVVKASDMAYGRLGARGEWQTVSNMAANLKAVCLKDSFIIYFAFLLIGIIEYDNLTYYDLFPVFFEIISAYGTVGFSLPDSDSTTILSGGFSSASKLVICFIMLLGRHRGLPHYLDASVTSINQFAPHGTRKRRFARLSIPSLPSLSVSRPSEDTFPPTLVPPTTPKVSRAATRITFAIPSAEESEAAAEAESVDVAATRTPSVARRHMTVTAQLRQDISRFFAGLRVHGTPMPMEPGGFDEADEEEETSEGDMTTRHGGVSGRHAEVSERTPLLLPPLPKSGLARSATAPLHQQAGRR
ncbi:unnamed protein product [Vitrella brassicaformis CCMP3155]|uniref:Uncharacterized protein n=1 Tax=Vitrella brassicaformis (strain CCMP3155) TaxID=1169540 RepID=A0A0G4FKY1_VITBC|nr:unnamed protein product [Vitrella brassicaformis CCMP3155]|eukprot:CEM14627.1 unnamed protein product [Vitrella brassicaformis CCMP3155]